MIKKATLIKENNKLKRKIFILENIGVTINSTIREKEEATKIFLEKHTDYTMYEVCSTIKLSKGTYYNYIHYKVDKPWFIEREEFLTKEIIEIFNNSKKLYGIERIQIALNNKGITAAINTISKIMKKNNLIPVSFNKRKRVFKYQTKEEKELNLVNRKFNQPRPNMVWVSDFLEIKSQIKKYYLCCIMDLYARKIVSYEINEKLNIKLALDCLSKAYKSRCINEELIIHTDRGVQFQSNEFKNLVSSFNIKQSFSCPGSPNDNACIEAFFSNLRREEININSVNYKNIELVNQYLSSYIHFYNQERLHKANNGLPPDEKERIYYQELK